MKDLVSIKFDSEHGTVVRCDRCVRRILLDFDAYKVRHMEVEICDGSGEPECDPRTVGELMERIQQ